MPKFKFTLQATYMGKYEGEQEADNLVEAAELIKKRAVKELEVSVDQVDILNLVEITSK